MLYSHGISTFQAVLGDINLAQRTFLQMHNDLGGRNRFRYSGKRRGSCEIVVGFAENNGNVPAIHVWKESGPLVSPGMREAPALKEAWEQTRPPDSSII